MLSAFKEVINPKVILNIVAKDKLLTIKENSSSSKIKKLHIKDVPENAFAFTLDYQVSGKDQRWYKQLSCYVNISNDKGVNKGCDLILLIPEMNKNFKVLIFDLKSDKPRIKDTEKQLINSELYVRYLISMVHAHYNVDINDVKYKKTIVTTDKNSIRKSATYRPNQKTAKEKCFSSVPVSITARKDAYVNLGTLLR